MRAFLASLFLLGLPAALPAQPLNTVCTLVIEASSGAVLHEEGDCDSRVTPASTFKLPLAVIGYDAGVLQDSQHPVLSFQSGDPDWGGENWTRDTTPRDWLRYSVVWYSQRITHALGAEAFAQRVAALGYGNADVTGDPGHDNGLERAWIASSLRISPREQAQFLQALVQDALPVSRAAMEKTRAIVQTHSAGSWNVHGKTGAAYPRRADRSFDYARGWGWFVGWAEQGDQQLIFVRLTQAQQRLKGSPGRLARDALLIELPELLAR